MSNQDKATKFADKIIEFAEGRVIQTVVLALISAISIWLFSKSYSQTKDGYWFLVMFSVSLLNLIFINSGSRKHIRIGSYFCLVIMATTLLLAMFTLLMYLIIFNL